MMAATIRGLHRFRDAPPWVFDDPLALVLVGPIWQQHRAELEAGLSPPVLWATSAMLLARIRAAEDRLAGGAFDQYVILGAGLDSFAWRRPDALAAGLTVFEVDHPSSQAWKRARIADLGLPTGSRHEFVPVDFETGTLTDGLDRAGFDWGKRTFFSWLGVVPYLTVEAIEAGLRSLAKAAPGSEVALTYLLPEPLVDETGRMMHDRWGEMAARLGEPLQTMWTPEEAEACARRCGFAVVDHPSSDDLHARYFAGRTDGLRPIAFETLLVVAVV